jgi:hypothetical protein
MRGCPVTVRLHPGDFSLQQADPFTQFILRIGIEQFARQLAGKVMAAARAILFVHMPQRIDPVCLAVNRSCG